MEYVIQSNFAGWTDLDVLFALAFRNEIAPPLPSPRRLPHRVRRCEWWASRRAEPQVPRFEGPGDPIHIDVWVIFVTIHSQHVSTTIETALSIFGVFFRVWLSLNHISPWLRYIECSAGIVLPFPLGGLVMCFLHLCIHQQIHQNNDHFGHLSARSTHVMRCGKVSQHLGF